MRGRDFCIFAKGVPPKTCWNFGGKSYENVFYKQTRNPHSPLRENPKKLQINQIQRKRNAKSQETHARRLQLQSVISQITPGLSHQKPLGILVESDEPTQERILAGRREAKQGEKRREWEGKKKEEGRKRCPIQTNMTNTKRRKYFPTGKGRRNARSG